MSTPFLEYVVLHCLHKLNGERTIYSIYHLLSGKKSSQTIQDAHLFQLTKFFKTYSSITRNHFDEIVKSLVEQSLIFETDEQYYVVTETGLETLKPTYPFLSFLDGWHFQEGELFWERLSLLVQVASHLTEHEAKYVPIQRNRHVQSWVKSFLRQCGVPRTKLSRTLYEELVAYFTQVSVIDPAVVVIRLTGFQAIGLTEKQANDTLGLEPTLYHYQFYALIHDMMNKIQSNRTSYPLLAIVLSDLQTKQPLTESTKKTYELLNKGFSLEEIGKIRNLKVNTIQDHIVELALQIDSFDITPFVDNEKINHIIAAKNKTTSKQLRYIKELVPDTTYFEIRLVMTKYGDEQ
ncbi:RQC domain-containing protein [Robertmurraya yapensis]|uniref:RQC domain-containing protein n=1 Tax=Bacillus yapensis TaxID=2492960 RepID=A0A3S0ISC6_9BACI|nr:helix-turn-helix domain-containing protein [Bacillus yapensis]RTR30398.1 RQC domain-containing protein [Bacillus yapensis]TKS95217.1 RQC domain-containing protein [Bacillus yapensis]